MRENKLQRPNGISMTIPPAWWPAEGLNQNDRVVMCMKPVNLLRCRNVA
jgi:hypothetical protein